MQAAIEKVDLPECSKGDWKVQKFVVSEMPVNPNRIRRMVPPGEYTRLMRGDTVVMSDTPAEMRDHLYAVGRAKGSCLINGLGLGMVLKAILKNEEVTDITVVDISQDVIDLVSPHYTDDRITFVCADALKYQPAKGKRFGMVWHDIWDTISDENLDQMMSLTRKYGKKADWQGSWCRHECEELRGQYNERQKKKQLFSALKFA